MSSECCRGCLPTTDVEERKPAAVFRRKAFPNLTERGGAMWKKTILAVLAALMVFCGCHAAERQDPAKMAEQARETLAKPFQTTAKVRYQGMETTMTIYKKPMNCAVVTFDAPDTLKEMKMTFYTDRVTLSYGEMKFDFEPDSVPGQAASKLILSALNDALNDQGMNIRQEGEGVRFEGSMEQGTFSLLLDRESGNLLQLSLPEHDLEMEVLNFSILQD